MASLLAPATRLGLGGNELVAGAILGLFQSFVLAPYSLRALWLIPVNAFLWDPMAVLWWILFLRYGYDVAWDLTIPFRDYYSITLRAALIGILQWLVLWYAFRMTKWWVIVSAIGWWLGQFGLVIVPIFLPSRLSIVASVFAGLIYGFLTVYLSFA